MKFVWSTMNQNFTIFTKTLIFDLLIEGCVNTITVAALLTAGTYQIYIHENTITKTVPANQELIAKGTAESVAYFLEQGFSIMDTEVLQNVARRLIAPVPG